MEYDIHLMKEPEIGKVCEIERLCFSEPWSEKSFMDELQNPNAVFLTCSDHDEVFGYAGFLSVLDEGYIANIAVHPSRRRIGVADALIGGLMERAYDRNLSFLTLEVRGGNLPAIALYKKHGFLPCGLRRGFYRKPTEDALLMKYTFGDRI